MLSFPGDIAVAAAGIDDEEEDGEDTEWHDGAEEDYATGVRAVVVVGWAVGGGREDGCIGGAHRFEEGVYGDDGVLNECRPIRRA